MPNPSATLHVVVRSLSGGYTGTLTLNPATVALEPGSSATVGFTLTPSVPVLRVEAVSALLDSVELTADKTALVVLAGSDEGEEDATITLVVE